MDKVKSVSDFLSKTVNLSKKFFFRGEAEDYGETACVAKAVRTMNNYDNYASRLDDFDRKVREGALFDDEKHLIPYAQHSGLATKLLDVTSGSLVSLYFACQATKNLSDGYVYVFDDYADVTRLLDEYPRFDLEDELIKHLRLLQKQKRQADDIKEDEINRKVKLGAAPHDELLKFGRCIEQYREKYLVGGHSKYSIVRGVSDQNSPFRMKAQGISEFLDEIKSWILRYISQAPGMTPPFLAKDLSEKTPAVDIIHPYQIGRYEYYNAQYSGLDIEVKEYLIALEALVAFINDRSPVTNLASIFQFKNVGMNFLPNMLYQPVLTFKRGLSQQSAFFVQTIFDKHESNFIEGTTGETNNKLERQWLRGQANYSQRIIVDKASKKSILAELDRIGINKASMFGDADSIADYIMATE